MTRIKICGLTDPDDAVAAAALGAWAIGVVLWPGSPRAASLARATAVFAAVPADVCRVAVLVHPSADEMQRAVAAGASMLQVHGARDARDGGRVPLIVARSLQDAQDTADDDEALWLLDAHDPVRHGGTGRVIDWAAAARVAATRPVLLAGGLTPANVGDAIATVRPWGVDVASGVEAAPGRKRRDLLEQFVAAVRAADQNGRGTITATQPEGARA